MTEEQRRLGLILSAATLVFGLALKSLAYW